MKKYYPVGIDLTEIKILVIGGGRIAERKIKKLLQYEGAVVVISPKITPALQSLNQQKRISFCRKKYSPNMLKKGTITFAATDSPRINSQIARDAKKKGVWINVVKPGNLSTFILPATTIFKNCEVSISTNGTSPKLAKQVKQKIEQLA